jgi:hypothetical protein
VHAGNFTQILSAKIKLFQIKPYLYKQLYLFTNLSTCRKVRKQNIHLNANKMGDVKLVKEKQKCRVKFPSSFFFSVPQQDRERLGG